MPKLVMREKITADGMGSEPNAQVRQQEIKWSHGKFSMYRPELGKRLCREGLER